MDAYSSHNTVQSAVSRLRRPVFVVLFLMAIALGLALVAAGSVAAYTADLPTAAGSAAPERAAPEPASDPTAPFRAALPEDVTSVGAPAPAAQGPDIQGPFSSEPVTPSVFDGDLRDLPTVEPWKPGDPIREVPQGLLLPEFGGAERGQKQIEDQIKDPLLKLQPQGLLAVTPPEFSTPNPNFDGVAFTGVNPPDTVGDVGPNHYIQMVNTSFTIYDKQGNLLAGPSAINSLWAGFGGPCQNLNQGDPYPVYDHLADRWLLSQFGNPTGWNNPPTNQCIAISRGPNPVTDGWYLYQFQFNFNHDYPKMALWPDGYYMSSQQGFSGGQLNAVVFDRGNMLNGNPATFQAFTVAAPALVLLPSDLDGPPPAAGTPNFFARHCDSALWPAACTADQVHIFAFSVDWGTPANSTFTQLPSLATAPFDSGFLTPGTLSDTSIPQPSATTPLLDTIPNWPMGPLQYRNFGTYETLVFNHTVDVDNSPHAGVRWYVLRRPSGGAWAINQQGTFSPDAGAAGLADDPHRWMGSIAMDKQGNIALGFSASSSTLNPSVHYVGRLATDPLGTMPHGAPPNGEFTMFAGTSPVQPWPGTTRWGDYSAMRVDPANGCTFWYTQEYGAGNVWRTRIGAFRFPTCDPADLSVEKWDSPDPVHAGEELFYTVWVTNNGPDNATNVVVTDTLPISTTYLADTDTCTLNVGTGPNGEDQLVCDLGNIPAEESRHFEIKLAVAADAVALEPDGTLVITNTVEVAGDQLDLNPDNNTDVEATIVQDQADLKVVKVSKPDTQVRAGELFTYTIFVDNLGPSYARGVQISDDILSSGAFTIEPLTNDPARNDACGVPVGTTRIECQLLEALEPVGGDPPPGAQSGRWVITVRVRANETQDVNNVARVFTGPIVPFFDSGTPDPDTSNNQAEDFIAVTDVADLGLSKTAVGQSMSLAGVVSEAPNQVTAGLLLTYTLLVTNTGPSMAENVVIEDNLPAEVEVVSVTSSSGTCSAGTPGDPFDPTTCTFDTLLSGETNTMRIVARVKPDAVTDPVTDQKVIHNDAWVFSDIFDPDNSDNLATNATTANARADLALAKFAIGTPRAGLNIHYEYDIRNLGPSVSRDVTLRDFLPRQVEFLSAFVDVEGGTGGVPLPCTVTVGSNAIFCPLGDIPPTDGMPILVFVNVHIKSDVPDSTIITNLADVNLTDTPDPNSANNSDSVDVTVLTTADLEIRKTSEPDKVFAGEQKKYTIWVHNIGPSDALTVTVTDTLPVSVTYEIDTDNCAVTGTGPNGEQILTCTNGTLKPSQTWEFDIWARVDPAVLPGTILTNTAVVTGNTTLGDPNLANNTATSKNLVLGKADLKITKFGKPDGQVRAGELLTYTVIVDNLGPGYAHDVVLTDVIQSSNVFTLTSVTSDRPATCTPTSGTFDQRLQLRCALTDPLEVMTPSASGRWIVTIVVYGDETQDINNVAHVISSDFDPNPANNQAFVMHEITDVADLEITKAERGEVTTDGCPPGVALQDNAVTAGLSLTYTLVITNYGPSTAENVVVQDRLPPWIVVTGATPSQGSCDTGTPGEPLDKLTCALGTLAVNASATIVVTADVPSWVPDGTILENDALVYSDIFDPSNANNFATNLTTVNAQADLEIGKSARGDNVTAYDPTLRRFTRLQYDNAVTAGELLQYTLVVTNPGPSDAQNVTIVDDLPANPLGGDPYVHFVSAAGAFCRQDPIDREKVTCDLGTLPAGASRTVYILVRVDPAILDGFVMRNEARVSSTTHDPCLGNNTAINDTTVNAVADIFITKVDVPAEPRLDRPFEPDQAIAGEEHRYLITFGNNGPSVSRFVGITDALDFKQAGILGETFVRCEPLDPDDLVTCAFSAPNTVTVTRLQVGNEAVIPSAGNGTLNPGEEFGFWLITRVDPGYVLDADATGTEPNLIAEDTAFISSTTTDYRTENNQDTEQTEIIAEADLRVSKTDTPDPGQNLYFDPVTQKFVYTYTLTIENLGPSDAAKVVLIDTLPADATFLRFGTLQDTQCYFRDDGTVFCLVGNDTNNQGTPQAGRLNAGSSKLVQIVIEVDPSAVDFLENCVEVRAIAEADFPFRPGDPIPPANFQDERTPTPDPDLTNNEFCETTTLVMPAVKVDKKAYVRYSPARGIDRRALNPASACAAFAQDDILVLPGDEVTYCYTITNEGDTWLHSVTLRDAPTIIVRTPTSDFAVAYPSQPPLRGTITVAGVGEAQTIRIATAEPAKAVLAPKGVLDDYDHILIVRSFTVDFPSGGVTFLGTNTARVDAVPSTKYSTVLPGIQASGDCDPRLPGNVCDTDLLHDTLAVPVLEETTKDYALFEDVDMDGLVSPGDTVEYSVDIPNTGAIQATGVHFYDPLFNYIADNPNDARVPGLLVNGSVEAAIHVTGRDTVSGEVFDFDVQPPDLAFGQTLLLRTQAPGVDVLIDSAVVLDGEILAGNTPGDDEVHIATRLAIPPRGYLLRIGGRVLPRPVLVTFSLRVTYLVTIKDTVTVDTVVLNHGWVDYNEIDLFDQRFPQFNPLDVWQFFATNRRANNHDGTPGRGYQNVELPGWPEIPAGVEPTNFEGPRFDDYALPGRPVRDDDDPTWFMVEREAPSIGADTRIQLPVLRYIGRDSAGVDALIEVQNVGRDVTRVALYLWASYSGYCDPQAPGPFKVECSGRLPPGSTWTWRASELPAGAYSGILVSYDRDLYSCTDMADLVDSAWLPDEYFGGQPIVAGVVRTGPGSRDPGVNMSGAYEGFSRAMEGVRDPVSDGFQYYVPNVYSLSGGFTSWLYVQNSGDECTSVEIWLRERDQCIRPSICRISKLSPGESYALDVAAYCGLGSGFEGSATLRSSQPLGIVVDNVGPDVLLTSRGVPADIDYGPDFNGPDPFFTAGSFVNYGPLIYREYQGWDSQVWVQNLSSIFSAKVKVYFLDNSGDIITTIVDWVCPRGSQKFFLPVISGLPGHYVGAVRVESQAYWSPGDPPVDSPRIMSVAELLKYEGPARAEVLEGIAYNLFGEDEAYDWQIGEIETWGVRRIAIPSLTNRAGGYTTELAIQNVVANPGFTDFAIYFYDQNGLIDYVCEKLNQKQVEYVAINTWGFIAPHFEGSAVISATRWTHAGNNPTGRSVGLAAVAVERVGTVLSQDIPGDESSGVQGFPIHRPFRFLRAFEPPACPGQP